MFNIGDKVVYPLHGAGTIEAIENHEVLGQQQSYYVLKLLMDRMKVMVPTSATEKVKLREVIQGGDVSRVIDILTKEAPANEDYSSDWRTRYLNNLEKMKSGCIYKVAEVAKNLSLRHKKRGLSSLEKKLLDNALSIIISEIAFAKNIDIQESIAMIEEVL
ncbi:MAG: CarD family transcriptional regulator [bacterium]